jgi:hypothetical protein
MVAFVEPVEGELDRRLPVSLDDPIVESHFGGDEAHLARAVTTEGEPRRTEQIEILAGPQLHLGNSPAADERPAGLGISSRHMTSRDHRHRWESAPGGAAESASKPAPEAPSCHASAAVLALIPSARRPRTTTHSSGDTGVNHRNSTRFSISSAVSTSVISIAPSNEQRNRRLGGREQDACVGHSGRVQAQMVGVGGDQHPAVGRGECEQPGIWGAELPRVSSR